MMNSAEGAVLHAVLEGHDERAAERLHEYFLDRELKNFRDNVADLLSLIDSEMIARSFPGSPAPARPTADTGEINIVRGRE